MRRVLGNGVCRAVITAIVMAVMCSGFSIIAEAADTLLPIRIKVVRCVTEKERIFQCGDEGLCCDLLDPAIDQAAAQPPASVPDFLILERFPLPADGNQALWLRTLSRQENTVSRL